MRTQFGQEVSKMEKTMNTDHIYIPKVWWFKHFTWIAEFMKTRSDQTPMSEIIRLAITSNSKADKSSEIILLNQVDASENLTDFDEEFDSPPRKVQKTIKAKTRSEMTSKDSSSALPQHIETIEYTLIDEDQNETLISEKSKSQFMEYQCERNLKKNKRRSKAFGKYISALLIDIDNDEIFFDLQNNITKLIQEAAMRQQNLTKS